MDQETQWSEVCKVAQSDLQNPETQTALNNIIRRFELPLKVLFRKRLEKFYGSTHHVEEAEDMLGEFFLYLLQRREAIFSKADINRGKLRTFLYTIAWRFSNDYFTKISRQQVSLDCDLENLATKSSTAYSDYEVEYVNVLINRALSRLKASERELYKLFKRKYFSQTQASAKDLAISEGLLPENSNDPTTIKLLEDRINKRLSRGRQMFFAYIQQEILQTLPSPNEALLQEEMHILAQYIGAISLDISSFDTE